MMNNDNQTDQEVLKNEENAKEPSPPTTPENTSEEETTSDAGEIKKLKDELAESKDKFLRLYAEFENHRRRTAKERIELIQSANEQLLRTLLTIADDFDRAEKSFKELNTKEAEGFFLIQNKFKKILEQNGLKPMETATSGAFDTELHEAISQVPVGDAVQKGKIIDVVEKGYLLFDKVIRHAKVVVGG